MTKTLHDLSDEFRIPVRKLRALSKAGWLTLEDKGRDPVAQMRYYLQRGQRLSVEQLLSLSRDPSLFEGLEKYTREAKRQVGALGNVAENAIPAAQAYTMICGGAFADADMLPRFGDWLCSVIPSEGCGYHYLAARMLWNVAQAQFAECYAFTPRAVVNARKLPALAEYLAPDDNGMRFQIPQKSFDL